MKHTENTNKLKEFISKKFINDELNNDSLLQISELCGEFLNLRSIPAYAKEFNMSYNGVKNNREIITLFGNKYVIDNN